MAHAVDGSGCCVPGKPGIEPAMAASEVGESSGSLEISPGSSTERGVEIMSKSETALARSEAPSPFGWLESFGPFGDLFGRRNRWIEDFFGENRLSLAVPRLPLDVTEADGRYVLTAEVP